MCKVPGFIPAHAGNTQLRGFGLEGGRAHPRACGEHGDVVAGGEGGSGSSPRMRGTLDGVEVVEGGFGLIPAHAGNTGGRWSIRKIIRAHPRACGEHPLSLNLPLPRLGSSPRMRGTLAFFPGFGFCGGLIPAHAGNTHPYRGRGHDPGAHPRACGEHFASAYGEFAGEGSSPRMRGTPKGGYCPSCRVGLIPAHAGNTSLLWRQPIEVWAHPRACGEHAQRGLQPGTEEGSSPRMRGTHFSSRFCPVLIRLIPAHAGNTGPATASPSQV